MYNELLPECVNVFLDDVETGLCLPIVLLIVLCTVQLTSRHLMQIGCTLWTFLKNRPQSQSRKKRKAKRSSFIVKKLRDMLCGLAAPSSTSASGLNGSASASRPIAKTYDNDDWDCCEDSCGND